MDVATLKADKTYCIAKIKTTNQQPQSAMANEDIRRADEQLKVIENQTKMARPIPVRLQQLQQQEAGLIKERLTVVEEVNAARGRAQNAVTFYESCKQSLADMDLEILSVQAQVSQAALEKADHEATMLGEMAGSILEDLKALAEKCGEGGLADHLRQALTMAATA